MTDLTHPSENFNFTLHTHQPVLEIKTEPDLIAGNLSYPTATLGSFSNLPCTFSPTLHLPYTLFFHDTYPILLYPATLHPLHGLPCTCLPTLHPPSPKPPAPTLAGPEPACGARRGKTSLY